MIKDTIGAYAADLIKPGMRVGLGTGTTAAFFIQHLGKRKLDIEAVASSQESQKLAQKVGIPLIDINTITHLDITVDGADEIDPQKRMIKGGGGALVREKIVASMSKEMIVIVDESKLVPKLGKRPLPVEVLPFAHKATEEHIRKLGYGGSFRKTGASLYITDNGNYIFDIQFSALRDHPEKDHENLICLPGVIDTGFFFHLAGRIVVGYNDGRIETR